MNKLSLVEKPLAYFVIFFYLFCALSANCDLRLPEAAQGATLTSRLYRCIKSLNDSVQSLSFVLGLNSAWTMFSWGGPMDGMALIMGESENGEKILLPIAGQTVRSSWQTEAVDYHEGMLIHCALVFHGVRAALAEYLCKQYGAKYHLKLIRFLGYSRDILSPKETARTGRYYGPWSGTEIEEIPCHKQ